MIENPRLLMIVPHPDDETIFFGGTLAYYAKRGVNVNLLVLTDGEKGKLAVTHPERGVIGFRSVEPSEMNRYKEERINECLRAANILGINQVFFLHLHDQGINETVTPLLQDAIRDIDPHVVITFNEAGTTLHPDHAWCGIATYDAVLSLINNPSNSDDGRKLNFQKLFNISVPRATSYEKYGEIKLSSTLPTTVDISEELDQKIKASQEYRTQKHLIDFFSSTGTLTASHEIFIERISFGESNQGKIDLFAGINEPDNRPRLSITNPIPLPPSMYDCNSPSFYLDLLSKLNRRVDQSTILYQRTSN